MKKFLCVAIAIVSLAVVSFPLASCVSAEGSGTGSGSGSGSTPTPPDNPNHSSLSAVVNSVLALTITVADPDPETNGLSFLMTPGSQSSGQFTAQVSSNQRFTLSVSGYNATNPSVANDMLHETSTTAAIHTFAAPVLSSSSSAFVNSEAPTGWGARLVQSTVPGSGNTPVTTANTDLNYYPLGASELSFPGDAVKGATVLYSVGISVGSEIASGTYTGTIAVTAANP